MPVTSTPKAPLACTFCGKAQQPGTDLVAGPGVHICVDCASLCHRMFTGKPTAASAGWKALSDDELLEVLPASAASVDAASAKLHEHVAMLRRRGVSWERVATALGVSRQAAWERFSSEN